MAGYLAFLTLLALFPFIIILVSMAGFFGQSEAGIQALQYLFENLPPDVRTILQAPIENMVKTTGKTILTFSILGALWVSSSAIDAARMAVSQCYNMRSEKSFIRRRIEGLVIIIFAALSIILGMSILVLGPVIWKLIISYSPIETDWVLLYNFIRFSLSLGLILGALSLIFFILKPKRLEHRSPVIHGALITLILWMFIGNGFSVYLKHFGNYDVTYGSLAGGIITLMFFFFLSIAFLFGAEINSTIHFQSLNQARKNIEADE